MNTDKLVVMQSEQASQSRFRDPALMGIIRQPSHDQHTPVARFFSALALCHTVVVEKPHTTDSANASGSYTPPETKSTVSQSNLAQHDQRLQYQAESPDEGALTEVRVMKVSVSSIINLTLASANNRRQEISGLYFWAEP